MKQLKTEKFKDITNFFEQEKKPVRVGNFWINNHIEYESNCDRNKLSIEECLKKIRPFWKDIMNCFKKSDTWKVHLMLAISFLSSKDSDEERVIHWKCDKIEIMINDKADEVKKEIFQLLLFRVVWINKRYWFHTWLCSFIVIQNIF